MMWACVTGTTDACAEMVVYVRTGEGGERNVEKTVRTRKAMYDTAFHGYDAICVSYGANRASITICMMSFWTGDCESQERY